MSASAAAPEVTESSGLRFLVDLMGRDPAAALARLHPDIEWTVPGDPALGGGAHRGRDAVLRFFARVLELFPSGLEIETRREWPCARGSVVEVVLSGETARARPYRNAYAFAIETRGESILRVREYTDTAHAEAVLRSVT